MPNELIASLILAVVQGITEWFPISSSGHLVLFERLLGFKGGLLFFVALHFGTLMAVFVYFGRDITEIIRDFFSGKWKTKQGRLGIMLIIGTIPGAILGFLLEGYFDTILSSLMVVAIGFGITGLFLFIASLHFKNEGLGKITIITALIIGSAQALAIFPGISRSGATIAAGLLIGLKEKEAMRFAFLLSIPIIIGANIIAIGNQTLPPSLIWATLVSFIVGLLSIHIVFKYVLTRRKNLKWFGIYCLVLAVGLSIYLLYLS